MAKKSPSKKAEATFESALEELEELIETMESDQLPLETLVSSYEKGAELLNHCKQILSSARKRIEVVQVGSSSEKVLDSGLKRAEDRGPASEQASDDKSDDIRLF